MESTIKPLKISYFWQILIVLAFFRIPSHEWFANIFTIEGYKIHTSEFIIFWFLIFLLSPALRGIANKKLPLPVWILSAYLIVVIFSFVLSRNHEVAWAGLSASVTSFLLFFMVYFLHQNKIVTKKTIMVLVGSGVIIAIYFLLIPQQENLFRHVNIMEEEFTQRAIPGIDKNTIGMQMGLLILFALTLIRVWPSQKFLWAGLGTLFFVVMTLTFSRGGFLSLLGGLFFLYLRGWFKFNRIISIGALAAGLIYSLNLLDYVRIYSLRVLSSFSGVSSRITDMMAYYNVTDTSNRLESLGNTFAFFLQSPLFGIGPLNLSLYQMDYFASAEHNTFFTILAESGIFALIIFVFAVSICVSASLRKLNSLKPSKANHETRLIGELLTAVHISNIINLNVAPPTYSFWICLALLTAWLWPRSPDEEPLNAQSESLYVLSELKEAKAV